MQSVSSRFWTRVAVSISYDNNHYTKGKSPLMIIIITKGFVQGLEDLELKEQVETIQTTA